MSDLEALKQILEKAQVGDIQSFVPDQYRTQVATAILESEWLTTFADSWFKRGERGE